MAIFHLNIQILGRGAGKSALAASAYRAGDKLQDNTIAAAAYRSGGELNIKGKTHNYTRKKGVVYTEIILPDSAPVEYQNRNTLWNAVELSEKRKDAQVAREVMVALPREFDLQENIEVTRAFVQENFVDKGMIADIAIHDKGAGNPHAHIMLTTRQVSKAGFGNKNRDWNNKAHLETWRERWAAACNQRLPQEKRIDHRTLEAQGIDREPTVHEGRNADRIKENQEIRRRNAAREQLKIAANLHNLKEKYIVLDQEIAVARSEQAKINQESQYISTQIKDIERHAEHIQKAEKQLDNLRAERRGMGWFDKRKKGLDSEITRVEQTCGRARNIFAEQHQIPLEQAPVQVAQLGLKLVSLAKQIVFSVLELADTQKAVGEEYKEKRRAAKARPDGQEILDRLARMEKMQEPQGVREQLDRAKIEKKLHPQKKRSREFERSR